MSEYKPRAFLLFVEIKLKPDMKKPVKYYIGVSERKDAKESLPWMYTMMRQNALRFKNYEVIGFFISKYVSEFMNIDSEKWDGNIYIQDVEQEFLVHDKANINYFNV